MAQALTFDVIAGLPWSKRVIVLNGVSVWSTVDDFEAKMHIRVEADFESRLKYDFSPHLIKTIEDPNIVIKWDLSGAETRPLRSKSGFFDLILSDVGDTDNRGIRAIFGRINIEPVVTTVGVV